MIGAGLAKPARNVLHSHATDDHGTPVALCELSRRVGGGGIDLDPFTSDYWNHHTVKAARHYTVRDDGYAQEWRGGLMQINPPGPVEGRPETRHNVRRAWEKTCEHWKRGEVDAAIWIGFALGQACTLQSSPMHPLQFLTGFLITRQCFLQRTAGGPPVPGESPTHANFVTLMPSRRSKALAAQQARIFVDGIRSLEIGGAVVRPV